jgi:hypothetical protein
MSETAHSQGRNGLLGLGWHLEGLPSIGRCPRTIAQDGVRGSINYDANDRFCLDGQRLVAISGTYGADGTEYRTEIESFSKVISRGGVRALHSDITAARPEQPTLSRPRTLPG